MIRAFPWSLEGVGNLTRVGDLLYFTVDDGHNGTEVWRTDGTDTGTELAFDVARGRQGSMPASLTEVDGALYFLATEDGDEFRLWRSLPGKEAAPLTPLGSYYSFTSVESAGDRLMFTTEGGPERFPAVWTVTNGDNAAVPLRTFQSSTYFRNFTPVGDDVFFIAELAAGEFYELWRTAGTPESTGQAHAFGQGEYPSDQVAFDGALTLAVDTFETSSR